MRRPLLALVALLVAHEATAGEDFVNSWGTNDPLIDQYGKHALCLESKSYFVNISDEHSRTCPKNTCRFERWRHLQYVHSNYANNSKYALRRIKQKNVKNYLYIPNTNVEYSTKRATERHNEQIYPRKVVVSILNADFGNQLYQTAFGQMVAEQHDAVFYTHFMDSHYRTGKDVTAVPPPFELEGVAAIRKYIDPIFLWELLPDSHPDKQECAQGNVTFTKRVYDIKHPELTNEKFNTNILEFIHPEQNKHNCLVILGFYKNIYPCESSIKSMWGAIEREIELSHSVTASLHRKTGQKKIDQKHRNTYAAYKQMAAHQGEFISKHRPAAIRFKRTKPKPTPPSLPSPKKKTNAFNAPVKAGHIIGDTSYERDNNPDLLLKRLRFKNLQKKQGKKGGLFLDGIDIS